MPNSSTAMLPRFTQAQIEKANESCILDLAQTLGANLRSAGREWIGACPHCGGDDRFSVNTDKNIFYCRGSDVGGTPVQLLMYVENLGFPQAVESLLGVGPEKRQTVPRQAPNNDDNVYRQQARQRAYGVWKAGERDSSLVREYFALRGMKTEGQWLHRLRGIADLPYFVKLKEQKYSAQLFRGPAILAAIQDAEGRFIGVHRTWVDLSRPKGKPEIIHPDTGEILASKKVDGSQQGGHIVLHDGQDEISGLREVALGEGMETVVSWHLLHEPMRDDVALWCAVNLKNMCGRSARSVVHPTRVNTDKLGRKRVVKVPGPEPDPNDSQSLILPDRFDQVVLLGDSDSDSFSTQADLSRGRVRHGRKLDGSSRIVQIDWARFGCDFNDELMEGAA